MAAPVPQQPGGQYQYVVQQPGGQQQLQQTPFIVQQTAGQHQPIVVHQQGGQNQPIVLPPEIFQQNVPNTQHTSSSPSRGNSLARQVTGFLQLLAAVVSILSTSIALAYGTEFRFGWGIWSGIFLYGLTGIFGMASRGRGRCLIAAYLVFSILSSISALGQLIYDSIAAPSGGVDPSYCYNNYDDYTYVCKESNPTLVVLHAVSAITAFCEMIIAIVASCLCCCGGLCTCGVTKIQQPSGQTMFVQYQQPGAPVVSTVYPTNIQQQIPFQHLPPNQQLQHMHAPQQQAPHQHPLHQQAPHQQGPHQQPPHQHAPHQQPLHQQAPHQHAPHQQPLHQQAPHQQPLHQQAPHQHAPHQHAPHQHAPHQQPLHQLSSHQHQQRQLPQTPPNEEDHLYEPPPHHQQPPPPPESTYAEAYQKCTLTPPHLNKPLPHPSSPADTPAVSYETGISPDLVPAYETNTTPTLDHTYMIPIETPTIEHTYMSK